MRNKNVDTPNPTEAGVNEGRAEISRIIKWMPVNGFMNRIKVTPVNI